MAIEWTNNFNDTAGTGSISFGLSGRAGSGTPGVSAYPHDTTALNVSACPIHNEATNTIGFKAGDEVYAEIDGSAQLYTISSVVTATGAGLVAEGANIVITPGLQIYLSAGSVFWKEDQYKGQHSSAENHLRKRNMGLI